jgi:hypothetical protein
MMPSIVGSLAVAASAWPYASQKAGNSGWKTGMQRFGKPCVPEAGSTSFFSRAKANRKLWRRTHTSGSATPCRFVLEPLPRPLKPASRSCFVAASAHCAAVP